MTTRSTKNRSTKNKAVKKKTVKKKDKGMGALLEVLRGRPQLVHAVIFNHARVKRLLKGTAAKKLTLGVNARKTLQKRVARIEHGGPAAMCLARTAHLFPGPFCIRGTWLPPGT
jgi:hypothetical protein